MAVKRSSTNRERGEQQQRNKGEEKRSRIKGSKATVRQGLAQSQLAFTEVSERKKLKQSRGM